jgi:hypothetical protein
VNVFNWFRHHANKVPIANGDIRGKAVRVGLIRDEYNRLAATVEESLAQTSSAENHSV